MVRVHYEKVSGVGALTTSGTRRHRQPWEALVWRVLGSFAVGDQSRKRKHANQGRGRSEVAAGGPSSANLVEKSAVQLFNKTLERLARDTQIYMQTCGHLKGSSLKDKGSFVVPAFGEFCQGRTGFENPSPRHCL